VGTTVDPVAAFLIVNVGNTLYALSGLTPSPLFGTLSGIVPLAAIWYWFWHYLVTHGVPIRVDTGLFLGMAPFVMIPVHVIRAEGWWGFLTLGGLAMAYLATYVIALILYFTAAS
jgi:hypothetical protein